MENKNIIAALVKAQLEISPPVKDGKNPMFKSKYATLDNILNAIRKPLADNGLILTHSVRHSEGQFFLCTTLMHTSGESLSNEFPMVLEKPTNQGMGSARTYACRYGICSLLSIPSDEDDDGNKADYPQQKTFSGLSKYQLDLLKRSIGNNKDLENKIVNGYASRKGSSIRGLEDIPSSEFDVIMRRLDQLAEGGVA